MSISSSDKTTLSKEEQAIKSVLEDQEDDLPSTIASIPIKRNYVVDALYQGILTTSTTLSAYSEAEAIQIVKKDFKFKVRKG